VITIGIDPHKSSLTAVAVDATSTHLAQRRFVVNSGTFTQLVAWAQRWPARQFAVEGAFGLGRGIAQRLAAAGEHVVDVPPTLSTRARLLSTGGGRKTDPADARSVAQVALHHPSLRQVVPEDQTVVLRLLSERRDDLAHERARVLNRLHQLFRELVPGGAQIGLSATKAAVLLRVSAPARSPTPAAASWLVSCWPTYVVSTSGSKATKHRSPARWPRPVPACPTSTVSGSCSPPKFWARSATSTASRQWTTSPATPAPPR
jgi:hypothetical protein